MSYEGWAKGWLQGVAETRITLERACEMLQARRERALCVSNPLGATGPHGKGGENPAERNVVGLIQAEQEYAIVYDWTTKALEEFDRMYKANRPGLSGTLADGMDAAELKYRHGMTEPEVMETLHISRSKLYSDQVALVDYLNHIGYARAMDPSIEMAT